MTISQNKIKGLFLGFFLCLTLFIWSVVLGQERNGLLTVAFLDVGQGDSIFIETPEGKQILVDAGPNKKVLRELTEQMPFYDRNIDVLIASHPDSDHIGGFPAIFDAYKIGKYFNSGVVCETALCSELNIDIEEEGIQKEILTRGQIIDLGDGVYLEVLFPDRDATNFETNLSSLVLKLTYGDSSFLLTGDSPQEIEEYLVSLDSFNLDVDVLKLGHHGSKTSSSKLLVGYTSPEFAIISVGKDNRYGHPHKEVLDILNEFEIEVLRTDEDGTIVIKSDGKNLFY